MIILGSRLIGFTALWLALACAGSLRGQPPPPSYFVIHAVDAETGRGVPLVEFETVNHIVHVTDSAGIVAFNEPGFMGREVYFHVRSHGYDFPADGFNNRGVRLTPRAGERATVQLIRRNVAERLYRITGAGIYRDSGLAGLPVPLREPVLNAQVLGQDTVIVTPYRGKLYWFWGDTDQVAYPLGNFAAAGATSDLPAAGGLAPGVGVNLLYFTGPDGFAKPMCPDFGPGLHWIESVFTLPDESSADRLFARVSSQHGLVPAHAWHLAVFNDAKEIFERKVEWPSSEGHDAAHPFRVRVDGIDYLYFYPNYRVRADWASVSDLARYEALTCIGGDGRVRGANTTIERDAASGSPRYRWQAGADRLHEGRVRDLVGSGRLQANEAWLHLVDYATGRALRGGRGSVHWNEYRDRWIWIMAPAAGEVWYAEGATPTGPWGYAARVVSHDNYNFYNVTQHPFFDEEGGRLVYFEGTYTASFSNAKVKTPRYDYNQIMYRLRLDDARLYLPEPIYRVASGGVAQFMHADQVKAENAVARVESVAWQAFAPPRAPAGTVAVRQDSAGRLSTAAGGAAPLFFALPAEPRSDTAPAEFRTATVVALYEYRRSGAVGFIYSVEPDLSGEGLVRTAEPICRVWRSPSSMAASDLPLFGGPR